jgi:DNA-binding transcriptional regulator of glucitol operon
MVREQNQGLALELGGHEFKPRMNPKSLELASTMKSLSVRMPEMMDKRKAFLKARLNEQLTEEMASCSFRPEIVAKKSDVYLKKMGRFAPRTPDDLLRYKDEKIRRNIQRKQIVEEVESKELTFKPQLPLKSEILKVCITRQM